MHGNRNMTHSTHNADASARLKAAIDYAEMGYRVFPCIPGGKTPATKHGCLDATSDVEQIDKWWAANPNYNVAISTDGSLVLDVDPAGKSWLSSIDNNDLAAGAITLTPRDGKHFWFKQNGEELRNTSGTIAPGVDTRANGGYVLVPPSIVNGKHYQWVNDLEPDQPAIPGWLMELLQPKENQPADAPPSEFPEGRRNELLFKYAAWCRGNSLDENEILQSIAVLNQTRCNPPLGQRELSQIAASAARYEPDGGREASLDARIDISGILKEERRATTGNGLDAFTQWRSSIEHAEPPKRFKTWTKENRALEQISLVPQEVSLFGAPPGGGKTALMLQSVAAAMLDDHEAKVLFANVEMPVGRLLDRLLANLARYELKAIYERTADWHDPRLVAAVEQIRDLSTRIHWLDAPFHVEHVDRVAGEFQPDIVVLDYVQRFDAGKKDTRSNVDATMVQARKLAAQGAAVLLVSSLSRGRDSKGQSTYDGHNGMAAFRESGELEFGVDEAYVLSKDEQNTVTFHHRKARYREIVDFTAQFVGKYQSFEEVRFFQEWTP